MATGRADHFAGTPPTATDRGAARVARGRLWAARLLTAVPVLALLMSAAMKLARPPQVLDVFVAHLGYPDRLRTLLPLRRAG